MWSVSHLCRCTASLRAAQSKLLTPTTRHGFSIGSVVSRQLITPAKLGHNQKGFRLTNLLRSNAIITRFCSTVPKPKNTKLVGYWLLGCSGMVFTAVVLGMVAGYLTLVYCVYYVVNLIVKTTNGGK